ncbi:MAG: MarR family transcriptional regulator [Gammaproteobacteria bacterium]|jgi:DNA-binding MarR family transcriptional regulator
MTLLFDLAFNDMNNIEAVLVALRRVIRATDLHSKRLSKVAGLTAPQLLILQTLRNKGDLPAGEIANDISLSQATVTTIMDRLESRNLITRQRSDPDKRKVIASITPAGLEILSHAPMPLQEHFVRKFSSLQEWEQTAIISSLQRVASMMDAENIDASPVLDVGALDRVPDSDKF